MTDEKLTDDKIKELILGELGYVLGNSKYAFTVRNFANMSGYLEDRLFPLARELGIDVEDISANCRSEILRSGGYDNISSEGLRYVKGRLSDLQKIVESYKP